MPIRAATVPLAPAAVKAFPVARSHLARRRRLRLPLNLCLRLAGDLARRLNADLFEIRPRDPWPEDYEEMVA